MKKLTDNLDSIAEGIRANLSAKDAAREKVLPLYREVIRYSSNAIRAIHRQELDKAEALLKSAVSFLNEGKQAVAEWDELSNAGAVKAASPLP
ncbi:hypothetical protein ACFLYL_05200 [Chloroflexota bacterium]